MKSARWVRFIHRRRKSHFYLFERGGVYLSAGCEGETVERVETSGREEREIRSERESDMHLDGIGVSNPLCS